jgi:hypothetical protein
MERDEKIAHYEESLMTLSIDIASSIRKQAVLLEKDTPLSSNEDKLLAAIVENLPDMKKERERLIAEIKMLKEELHELVEPPSSMPARG